MRSLRTIQRFFHREYLRTKALTRQDDLTAGHLAIDVATERMRVAELEHLLEEARERLARRVWEFETYQFHGIVPDRKGLKKRIDAEAKEKVRRALRDGGDPGPSGTSSAPRPE
jgi:hypothetical protein